MPSFHKPPTVSDDYRAIGIYRSAARIIHERGFHATSMGDVADAVDLTKGGLYYYIKGKAAMLFAIMNFAMNQVEAEVLRPALEVDNPERRLQMLIEGHAKIVIQEPDAMTILVNEEDNLVLEHRAKIAVRKREYTDTLRDTIRQVLHGRGDHDLDPSIATYSIFGMLHWIVRWHDPEGRLSDEAVVRQISRLVRHGLIPQVEDAPRPSRLER